jgi:hypothetical protein
MRAASSNACPSCGTTQAATCSPQRSSGTPATGSAASVRSFESQYYSPEAHLKVAVIPDTGHDLALSTTAPITDAVMIGWSLSVIAP